MLLVVFLVVLETNLLSLFNITDIMLRASGKRNPAPNLEAGAKKKRKQGKFNLWADKSMVKKGLETLHGGQSILLKAEDIWGAGNVPAGQEKYLYQYHIYQINEDCKTAIIEFDDKYVEEGGIYPTRTETPKLPSISTSSSEKRRTSNCSIFTLAARTKSTMTGRNICGRKRNIRR